MGIVNIYKRNVYCIYQIQFIQRFELILREIMSTNSKFIKNRVRKLIGKQKKQEKTTRDVKTPEKVSKIRQSPPTTASIFRDYTFISLEQKSGNITHNVKFFCFSDNNIYNNYIFPKHGLPYDNDEDSNNHQIRADVRNGFASLLTEIEIQKQKPYEGRITRNCSK